MREITHRKNKYSLWPGTVIRKNDTKILRPWQIGCEYGRGSINFLFFTTKQAALKAWSSVQDTLNMPKHSYDTHLVSRRWRGNSKQNKLGLLKQSTIRADGRKWAKKRR